MKEIILFLKSLFSPRYPLEYHFEEKLNIRERAFEFEKMDKEADLLIDSVRSSWWSFGTMAHYESIRRREATLW